MCDFVNLSPNYDFFHCFLESLIIIFYVHGLKTLIICRGKLTRVFSMRGRLLCKVFNSVSGSIELVKSRYNLILLLPLEPAGSVAPD